ncbi:hypothetical protein V8D89_008344 [Ganoderma adspersum]
MLPTDAPTSCTKLSFMCCVLSCLWLAVACPTVCSSVSLLVVCPLRTDCYELYYLYIPCPSVFRCCFRCCSACTLVCLRCLRQNPSVLRRSSKKLD